MLLVPLGSAEKPWLIMDNMYHISWQNISGNIWKILQVKSRRRCSDGGGRRCPCLFLNLPRFCAHAAWCDCILFKCCQTDFAAAPIHPWSKWSITFSSLSIQEHCNNDSHHRCYGHPSDESASARVRNRQIICGQTAHLCSTLSLQFRTDEDKQRIPAFNIWLTGWIDYQTSQTLKSLKSIN